MKNTEFFYWLQGYFEISGSQDHHLTQRQASLIADHVQLVPEDQRGARLIKIQLCVEMIIDDSDLELALRLTRKIQQLVDDTFEHVIDPLAGGPDEQARLNAIHSPGEPVPLRC